MYRDFSHPHFYREDTCILLSDELPIDRNDPEGAKSAIELTLPEGFSDKAKACWKYLEGAAAIFLYKGRLILTDESLELTNAGDGGRYNPYGGPRWKGTSWKGLEHFLEDGYDELLEAELI